ncbi:hypothetical protein D3C72_2231390 [compost metagenome]
MELNPTSKANMSIVDKLLDKLPDWEDIIIVRHVKFVESYINNNRNLEIVAKEFEYSNSDMLGIFWRIQKQLQLEHSRRVEAGIIEKSVVFVVKA